MEVQKSLNWCESCMNWDLNRSGWVPSPTFWGIYCCQTRLCLCLVCWFFSKHCRSLGWKNEKRNDLELFQCWTLPGFLFLLKILGFFVPFQSHLGSVPCASFIPSPLFVLLFGGTFLIVVCRLNGHLVFPGSGGSSPPWFLRDRWSLWMQIEIPSTGSSLSLT